jgi:hypothetical protein
VKKLSISKSKESQQDKELSQQQAMLEKLKFEVGQEMGLSTKEKYKNN